MTKEQAAEKYAHENVNPNGHNWQKELFLSEISFIAGSDWQKREILAVIDKRLDELYMTDNVQREINELEHLKTLLK